MALAATPYPASLEFHAEDDLDRWRPLVQWLLAIPHLLIVSALSSLREVLLLVSFFTVVFTKTIPRPLFDAIAMTYRYEWRVLSYSPFLHDAYPPFDFAPTADDDGADGHSVVAFEYPEQLSRWQPFVKWVLALPHYVVLALLLIGSVFAVIAGMFAVVATGRYPHGLRNYLVGAYRYGLRVQAYVGLLTDRYPPFTLAA